MFLQESSELRKSVMLTNTRLLTAHIHLTRCSNWSANILCRYKSHYRITYTFISPEHIWRWLFRECRLPCRIWMNLGRILKWLSCPSLKRRRWDMDVYPCIFTKLFTKGNKKSALQNYTLLMHWKILWFCFKMSMEHKISLSNSNYQKR